MFKSNNQKLKDNTPVKIVGKTTDISQKKINKCPVSTREDVLTPLVIREIQIKATCD